MSGFLGKESQNSRISGSSEGGDHRNNIFEFFRSHTAFDLLPESGKVCLLDSSLSAFAALSIMASNQQQAVPVWDSRADSYVGMLTVTDLVEMVLACRSSKLYSTCSEALKAMTLEHWMCHNARPHGCPLPSVEVRPDDDLLHVLWTLVRNNCRVVPVLEREGSRRDTVTLNQCLVGQISYLLLFRFLFFHQVLWQSKELDTLEGSLKEVGIGTFGPDRIISVQASDPVSKALEAMSKYGISGVPVLDPQGGLLGVFADSDLLGLDPDMLHMDLRSVLVQGAARVEAGMAAGPAPEWSGQGGCGEAERLCTCRTDDALRVVVERFNRCRSARLACISPQGRVEGIVTLTDLFKFLAGSSR